METHLLHHAQCMAPRDYGCFVDGVRSVCVEGHQRMPALMVRCPLQRLCRPHHRPVTIQCHTSCMRWGETTSCQHSGGAKRHHRGMHRGPCNLAPFEWVMHCSILQKGRAAPLQGSLCRHCTRVRGDLISRSMKKGEKWQTCVLSP